MEFFGQRLKRMLKERGRTQLELAQFIGRTRTVVYQMRRTTFVINHGGWWLRKVARFLGVTMDELLEVEGVACRYCGKTLRYPVSSRQFRVSEVYFNMLVRAGQCNDCYRARGTYWPKLDPHPLKPKVVKPANSYICKICNKTFYGKHSSKYCPDHRQLTRSERQLAKMGRL
jgi:hypothetical protein